MYITIIFNKNNNNNNNNLLHLVIRKLLIILNILNIIYKSKLYLIYLKIIIIIIYKSLHYYKCKHYNIKAQALIINYGFTYRLICI